MLPSLLETEASQKITAPGRTDEAQLVAGCQK